MILGPGTITFPLFSWVFCVLPPKKAQKTGVLRFGSPEVAGKRAIAALRRKKIEPRAKRNPLLNRAALRQNSPGLICGRGGRFAFGGPGTPGAISKKFEPQDRAVARL